MADPEQTLTMEQYLALPEQERMAARVRSLEAVLQASARPVRRYDPRPMAGRIQKTSAESAENQAHAQGYKAARKGLTSDALDKVSVQEAAKEADLSEEQVRAVIRHFRQQ